MADDHFRNESLGLLRRLVRLYEADTERRAQPPGRMERWLTPSTVALGAMGLVITILVSQCQLRSSSEQFDRSLRQNVYSDILNGLGSGSVGVQVGSLQRLVQYVADEDNFDDEEAQRLAAENALQTFGAFIADESATEEEGLTDYRDPQPIVVQRAFAQLINLLTQADFADLSVDISRGNFHGVYEVDVDPRGTFIAVGADFRSATLTGWDFSEAENVDLRSAFFTCANLQTTDFGSADVDAADFTGANLRGADLSEVRNLRSEQLHGALVGEKTLLPPKVARPSDAWGVAEVDGKFRSTTRCRRLLDEMTHLLAGSGYASRLPCGRTPDDASRIELTTPQRDALRDVCALRTDSGAGG